jgi:ERCC4-type nuclease
MTDIIIDFREKEIIYHCQLQNEKIKVENLHLGDIRIDKLLIERKTINDLAASIVDGRYKEQSIRLMKALQEGFQVFYFIEGNIDLYTGSIKKTTLVSTIFSLTQKGFQVITTKNSKETSFFIIQFAEKMKKIKKEKDKETQKDIEITHESNTINEANTSNEANTQTVETTLDLNKNETVTINVSQCQCKCHCQNESEMESIVTKKKNKQITRENISIFMLCQIPGISNATAKRIVDKYGHISDLIVAIKSNQIDVDENGKKFNKNIIKNIHDYLE